MKSFYKIISISTALLFLFLFVQLFFMSDSFVTDLGLEASTTSLVLARRAAMFMLGISVLAFASRNLVASKARLYISISIAVTFLGLSCMGITELINGNVNSSILVAIIIETILWISYGIIIVNEKKTI